MGGKAEKTPNSKNSINRLDKSVRQKNTMKIKVQRCYSTRENVLVKALAKQKKVSHAWYEDLQATNLKLEETNERLQNYKHANKGHFEMAVEAETNRRMKEICQPLAKAIQLNVNNVVCLLDSLTDMKTLVASLIKTTDLSRPPSISRMQGLNSTPKAAAVERRRNIVHPMVKGHVLQPAMINIPRVSMRGLQSCMLNNTTNTGRSQLQSTDIKLKKNIKLDSQARNLKMAHCNPVQDSDSKSSTDNNYEEHITAGANPPRREDPLEGPSWLYNGRRRKIGQNRKQVMDRIKMGTKAPHEYFVYVDSSSDTDLNSKRSGNSPRKRRRKSKSTLRNPTKKSLNKHRTALPVCPKSLECAPQKNDPHTQTDLRGVTSSAIECDPLSVGNPSPLPFLAKECSVVLKREEDNFGFSNYRTDDSETPSDKENIPPAVASTGDQIKLRGIAVVIEDIMKKQLLHSTPYKKMPKRAKARIPCKVNMKISTAICKIHNRKKNRNANKPKRNLLKCNVDKATKVIFNTSRLLANPADKEFDTTSEADDYNNPCYVELGVESDAPSITNTEIVSDMAILEVDPLSLSF